jgi:predicted GH43/DUF377 family glycosyl hydrolase
MSYLKTIFIFMFLVFFSILAFGNNSSNWSTIREGEFEYFDLSSLELEGNKVVKGIKQIKLENFPNAFNPSILKVGRGYLLSFRYQPDLTCQPWRSDIGVVFLNELFEPMTKPQLIDTRENNISTPSQSEDARLISCQGRIFLIYNDNRDELWSNNSLRRDMYKAEVLESDGKFTVSPPQKLVYFEDYYKTVCQKNWTPFEWDNKLFFGYTLNPHLVLNSNMNIGACYGQSISIGTINWSFGALRGGTPAQLVDGEYLAFFHSSKKIMTHASLGQKMWHYFAGAYTFSNKPPFQIQKISSAPIVVNGFYTYADYYKRVIFPGGYVVSGDTIFLAYGKDDCEMWIAAIDKKALLESLVPVKTTSYELR